MSCPRVVVNSASQHVLVSDLACRRGNVILPDPSVIVSDQTFRKPFRAIRFALGLDVSY